MNWQPVASETEMHQTTIQGGPKSKLLRFVHIFVKYRPIFTIFLLVNFVKTICHSAACTPHLLCCYTTL